MAFSNSLKLTFGERYGENLMNVVLYALLFVGFVFVKDTLNTLLASTTIITIATIIIPPAILFVLRLRRKDNNELSRYYELMLSIILALIIVYCIRRGYDHAAWGVLRDEIVTATYFSYSLLFLAGIKSFRKIKKLIMPTLFSKIIAGEIPSFKIYEDEFVYAFLDIFPQTPGHTLIVPKIEIDHFADVPEPYYSAIFLAAKKLSPAIQKATGCARVCALFMGYEVPHCHYQLIPTNTPTDLNLSQKPQATTEELQKMQEKILSELNSDN